MSNINIIRESAKNAEIGPQLRHVKLESIFKQIASFVYIMKLQNMDIG